MFDMKIAEVYSVNQETDIGKEILMKLRLLLFILYQKLKKAAKKNAAYRSFLGNMQNKRDVHKIISFCLYNGVCDSQKDKLV